MKTRAPLILALLLAAHALPASAAAPVSSPPRTEELLENVFERVHSSVVTIRTKGRTGLRDRGGEAVTAEGVGSGVLISDDGRILTAAHVVQTADEVEVEFVDGTKLPARVIGSVRPADLALVALEGPVPDGFEPVGIGDSAKARIGASVFVVGASLGLSQSLTVGHISARRAPESPLLEGLGIEIIQTDAAINLGNSGGPMFNMNGEVIGIVSYLISRSGGSEGLGFAIASSTARRLVLDRHPFWSGTSEIFLGGRFAQAFNLPDGMSGMLVQHVAKNSPGERLGLRGGSIPAVLADQEILLGGDVILAAFGVSLSDEHGIVKILGAASSLTPDGAVTVQILRGGEVIELVGSVAEIAPGLGEG